MKKTEIRQSNIHEKLFIATGNAFDPESKNVAFALFAIAMFIVHQTIFAIAADRL